jgi:hypothetical protein
VRRGRSRARAGDRRPERGARDACTVLCSWVNVTAVTPVNSRTSPAAACWATMHQDLAPVGRYGYGSSLWNHILRDQLQVTEAGFWACVRDGIIMSSTPVSRRCLLATILARNWNPGRGHRQLHRPGLGDPDGHPAGPDRLSHLSLVSLRLPEVTPLKLQCLAGQSWVWPGRQLTSYDRAWMWPGVADGRSRWLPWLASPASPAILQHPSGGLDSLGAVPARPGREW